MDSTPAHSGGKFLRRLEAVEAELIDLKKENADLKNWKRKMESWLFEEFEVKFDDNSPTETSTSGTSSLLVNSQTSNGNGIASSSKPTMQNHTFKQCNGESSNNSEEVADTFVSPAPSFADFKTKSGKKMPVPLLLPKVESEEFSFEKGISISAVRSLKEDVDPLNESNSVNNNIKAPQPSASIYIENGQKITNIKDNKFQPKTPDSNNVGSSNGKSSSSNQVVVTESLNTQNRESTPAPSHYKFNDNRRISDDDEAADTPATNPLAINPSDLLTRKVYRRNENSKSNSDDEEICVVFTNISSSTKINEGASTSTSNQIVQEDLNNSSVRNLETYSFVDDDTPCAVCTSIVPEPPSNNMVFCDKCNICVHQACYGITSVPINAWTCDPCSRGLDTKTLPCYFCPNLGGALKYANSPAKTHWGHVSCALWIPEVTFGNTDIMHPIINIQKIDTARYKLKCTLCKINKGACIQCYFKRCPIAFHVTCARTHGLEMKEIEDNSPQGISLQAFCQYHRGSVSSKKKSSSPKKKSTSPTKKRKLM